MNKLRIYNDMILINGRILRKRWKQRLRINSKFIIESRGRFRFRQIRMGIARITD